MCGNGGSQRSESPQVQWRLFASAVSARNRCGIFMVQMCFVNNPKLDDRINLSTSSSRQNRPAIDSEWLEHAHPYIACYQEFIEYPVWLQNRTVQVPRGLDSQWSILQQPCAAVNAIVSEIVSFSQEIEITSVRRVSLLKRGQHAQHIRRAFFILRELGSYKFSYLELLGYRPRLNPSWIRLADFETCNAESGLTFRPQFQLDAKIGECASVSDRSNLETNMVNNLHVFRIRRIELCPSTNGPTGRVTSVSSATIPQQCAKSPSGDAWRYPSVYHLQTEHLAVTQPTTRNFALRVR